SQIETLRGALSDGEPKLATMTEAATKTSEALREAEAKLAEWQSQWDAYAKFSSDASKEAEVERTRLDYLDKQALETARRLETLHAEKKAADFDALNEQVRTLSAEHDTHREKVETYTKLLDERR